MKAGFIRGDVGCQIAPFVSIAKCDLVEVKCTSVIFPVSFSPDTDQRRAFPREAYSSPNEKIRLDQIEIICRRQIR